MTLGINTSTPSGFGGRTGGLTGSSGAFNPSRGSLSVADPVSPQAQGAGRATVRAQQVLDMATYQFPDGHTETVPDTPENAARLRSRGGVRVAKVTEGINPAVRSNAVSHPGVVVGGRDSVRSTGDGRSHFVDPRNKPGFVESFVRGSNPVNVVKNVNTIVGEAVSDTPVGDAGAAVGSAIERGADAVTNAGEKAGKFLVPDKAVAPTPINLGGAGGSGGVGGLGGGAGGLGGVGGGAGGAPGSGGVVADRIGRRTLAGTGLLGAFGQGLEQQDQIRGGQLQSLADLQAAARGETPSAAELQSRRDIQRAIAGQFALASSARGGAGAQALAQRAAQSQAAQLTADQAGRAAILRAQETDQARRTLANALGQTRAQDFQVADLGLQSATTQLGADLDAARADQATSLQAQEANLDARLQELGINADLLTAQQRNQLAAALQFQQLQTQVELANAGLLRADRDAILGGIGDILGVAGVGGKGKNA